MEPNIEGFLHPVINQNTCIDCGKCSEVCPPLNGYFTQRNIVKFTYASFSKDEKNRLISSSGGVFSEIAKKIIENGGVVYAAAYNDELYLEHCKVQTLTELKKLKGSKYVQSDIKMTYSGAKDDLNRNKPVLFVGTPCQISGFKFFLGREYNNLYTIDIICKGVPSPEVFRKNKEAIEKKYNKKIKDVRFRDKRRGWKSPTIVYSFEDCTEISNLLTGDSYGNGFSKDLFLRKSCYKCKYATKDRLGDITLGDFWGLGSEKEYLYDKEKGVSVVFINTKNGIKIFDMIKDSITYELRDIDEVIKGNSHLCKASKMNVKRKDFFDEFQIDAKKALKKYTFKTRLLSVLNYLIRKKNYF